MDDREGFVRIRVYSGGQAASVSVVYNQDHYIGAKFVPELVHFLHNAVAPVGQAPNVVEMRSFLDVSRLVRMYQSELNVLEPADAERLVGLSNGQRDEIRPDVIVVTSCISG